MIDSQLLCTFTTKNSLSETILNITKAYDIVFGKIYVLQNEDKTTEHGRPMINLFCSTCGTQIGIKVPSMKGTQHISIGTIDQRKNININCNIWGQEALQFIGYSKDAEVYKTGYWNGTGEKMKIEK